MTKPFVIAIDGPAASGKGTLAKKLATHYSLPHLDTGLTYRAIAYSMLEHNIDLTDEAAAVDFAEKLDFAQLDPELFASHTISEVASKVALLPRLRGILVSIQRQVAEKLPGAVLDGRDIGTVVCPSATVKLYIIADMETRARRRYDEIIAAGMTVSYNDVLADLKRRDERDMHRSSGPLKPAEDSYLLNTTKLNIEEMFEAASQLIDNERAKCSGFR
ncbi:MAG: cytidylate kinase [Candidatus Tokpelaia sp. JSC189]|nr:MAG: cytidylate kinase [Candidatus Tokpelaia sp. JSC189]